MFNLVTKLIVINVLSYCYKHEHCCCELLIFKNKICVIYVLIYITYYVG